MMIAMLVILLLVLIGVALMLVAAYGVYKMPDLFLRMSASTKASTLGAAALLLAAAVRFGNIYTSAQAIITILFLLITAPVGAHVIGRAAYHKKRAPLFSGTVTDDLRDYYRQQEQNQPPQE